MTTATPVAASPFHVASERIARFRDASRARGANPPRSPQPVNMNHAFFDLYAKMPFWKRYARSVAYTIENEPVYVFDDEQLVGMVYHTNRYCDLAKEENEARWRPFNAWHKKMEKQQAEGLDPMALGAGYPGHIGWRWARALEVGITGIIQDVCENMRGRDIRRGRLCSGALILLNSVLAWNEKHLDPLERKLRTSRGAESRRISKLIEICRQVPARPARNFHEAVQSFYVQHLAVMYENPYGGNGPGRLDYFLWPYLERDLKEGTITLEEARELIDELFIRLHERIQGWDGWVESIVLGGVRPDGRTAVNPLSYIMIDSIAALDQTHPSVYVRLSKDSPEKFVDRTVQYLLHGRNRAQVYNDDACIPAIVKSGIPAEDAAMYMAGGCMEISVQGMTCDLNFSHTHNVAKTLELVVNGGVDLLDGTRRAPLERDLTGYSTFAELYRTFEGELERLYAQVTRALDITSECLAKWRPCYLLSTMIGDCIERGRDQQDGGARYHDAGFAPLGITAAADSLTGIKQAVFDERFVSAQELLIALRANFEGYEALRLKLRNIPKFGVQDPEADAMCNRVLASVCEAAARQELRFRGRLKPMIFNFVWTPGASKVLGARGDGSRAGETIGQGLTPASAAMTEGITAAMNSSTSLDWSGVSGGATTMWDMDEAWINFDVMKSLLKTFLARGGMIFQGNTTGVKELEEALDHPERFPNLIVRVGGFSARFVTLDKDCQREIIARRRHRG